MLFDQSVCILIVKILCVDLVDIEVYTVGCTPLNFLISNGFEYGVIQELTGLGPIFWVKFQHGLEKVEDFRARFIKFLLKWPKFILLRFDDYFTILS